MFPAEYGGVASVVVMQCCMGKHVDPFVCEACSSISGDGRAHDLCNDSSAVYACAHRSCMRI